MEYAYLIVLIVQSSFLLLIFSPHDRYLVKYNEFYKKYLIVELIIQVMCVVANVILLFVMKEIMIYVLATQLLLMSSILDFYSRKSKKKYFDELLNIIVANDLQSIDSIEIRRILLVKYEKVYFVDDIEKCLLKINK